MADFRRNDLLIPFLTVLCDAVATVGAFLAAYGIRFYSPLIGIVPVTKGVPPLEMYLAGGLITAPIWILMFQSKRVYRPRRGVDASAEFFLVARVVSYGMLVVFTLAFFYREFSYSRLVFLFIWVFSIAFITVGRAVVLALEHRLYERGRELRNVMLIGVNAVAQNIALWLKQRRGAGYRLVGYASNPDERLETVEVPRICGYEGIADAVDRFRIETVILCMNDPPKELLNGIMDALAGRNVQFLLQADVIGITPTRLRLQEFFGLPFLGVKDIPMTTWGRIVKRSFDIAVAGIVLIVFAPLWGLVALLILLESGKPVLYRQTRVGLYGEEFTLLKFRTMHVDAERESGPTWTRKNDPRITRVGRWLRRFSIDEIPQFVNILRGEMSIVGPRPERPEFVRQFRMYVPKYLERHRVKTGLTGWAQVNGLRGEVPIVERTKYDIYYIENWSFNLDLRIILKTARTVLFGKDAY
ncbi:MAG: undecaprenyl-phosphate glucose phosphotransferase [Bacteroidota bacterium]|nr:undecaprenyl-phosphate glucose phosphotransferase [Bacteroidota bacterium]